VDANAINGIITYANYAAWVVADDPATALATWPRVTLQATNTAGRNGPTRRQRASQINALKRAIERVTGFTLTLTGRAYSETFGFMHASYFTYRIDRA
jgi:hypothetical protein